MQWTVDEPWQKKLDRLTARIDQLHTESKLVSLIGESAGASAVTQALNLRTDKLNGVVLLCGKSRYPDWVAAWRYSQNPALHDALTKSQEAMRNFSKNQKARILNLHPVFDPVVPVAETRIEGVKNSMMPIIGHATSIVFANTLWSWRIVRFIRLRARLSK